LPPESSGMNTYTIPLYTYEITKGFGGRKLLRKDYRSIKVGRFGKVLSFLPFPLATELREILGGLLYHIGDGMSFQIFLPDSGRGALEGRFLWSQKVTNSFRSPLI
jgi:hypothetical protein